MQYHVRKTSYQDGCMVYAVCPQMIQGNKKPPSPPLEECPFTGELVRFQQLHDWLPEELEAMREKSRRDAVNRAKKNVEAFGRCNHWDFFITLTFDPEKVNSFDYSACVVAMKKWLDVQRHVNPGMKYIVVFEPHKSGRYHVHGLVSGVRWNLKYAKSRCGQNGKRVAIYNLSDDDYNLGFSTVSRVCSSGASATYISKYISKTLEVIPVGSKRYWASRNLSGLWDNTICYVFDKVENLGAFMERLYDVADSYHWVKVPCSNKAICYFTIYGEGVT